MPETDKASEAAQGDKAPTELEQEAQGAERLEGVARLASEAQPKGHTLDSAGVHVKASHTICNVQLTQQHNDSFIIFWYLACLPFTIAKGELYKV